MKGMLEGLTTTTTAKKELLQNTSEIAYVNFISSIRAEQSKKKYAYLLDLYIEFLNLKGGLNELSLLLDQNAKTIENSIISYILQLKKENYSYSTINTRLAAIAHFYTMNDIIINRKKISKYLGEHIKTIKDRAYTIDEIKKIVDACDLKYKIIVTMMASTGCRIGAISPLKLSDLIYIKNEKLHKIYFYTNTKEEYYSFCTPECSKFIIEYLEYRERCGEKINPESPLIRDVFTLDDLLHIENAKHVSTRTFAFYLRNILIKTGLRVTIPREHRGTNKKKTRKEVSANHGFRKFCHTTMANAGILPEVREMLLGHSLGISDSYYKPTEKEMLLEYLKVVDNLTINEENRLSKQVQELQEKNEDSENVIKGKLQEMMEKNHEKDIEIEKMQQTMNTAIEQIERFKESIMDSPKIKAVTAEIEEIKTASLQQQSKIKILLEIDKKREELFATKGFVTREDMESIYDSYRDQILGNK